MWNMGHGGPRQMDSYLPIFSSGREGNMLLIEEGLADMLDVMKYQSISLNKHPK